LNKKYTEASKLLKEKNEEIEITKKKINELIQKQENMNNSSFNFLPTHKSEKKEDNSTYGNNTTIIESYGNEHNKIINGKFIFFKMKILIRYK
jgi:hypothetical protein